MTHASLLLFLPCCCYPCKTSLHMRHDEFRSRHGPYENSSRRIIVHGILFASSLSFLRIFTRSQLIKIAFDSLFVWDSVLWRFFADNFRWNILICLQIPSWMTRENWDGEKFGCRKCFFAPNVKQITYSYPFACVFYAFFIAARNYSSNFLLSQIRTFRCHRNICTL